MRVEEVSVLEKFNHPMGLYRSVFLPGPIVPKMSKTVCVLIRSIPSAHVLPRIPSRRRCQGSAGHSTRRVQIFETYLVHSLSSAANIEMISWPSLSFSVSMS